MSMRRAVIALLGALSVLLGGLGVPAFASTLPDPPTGIHGEFTSGDGEFTDVYWTAPANDGGIVIDAYEVRITQDGGAHWQTIGGTDCIGADCPPETFKRFWYTFTIYETYVMQARAHNANGWSVWSVSSPSYTANPGGRARPLPPREFTAIADDHSILLRWTPAPDPYSAWRHWYVIEWITQGGSWSQARSAETSARSYLITGLDETKSWQVRIRTYRGEIDSSLWRVLSGIRMADRPQIIVGFSGLPLTIARNGRTLILPCNVQTNRGRDVRAYIDWSGPRWRAVDDDAVIVRRTSCGSVVVVTKGQPVRIRVGLWATPDQPWDGLLKVRIYRTWDSGK